MSTKLEGLAIELLGLPASDRALLARQLIASLDDVQTPECELLWLEEAQKRSTQIDQGAVDCIPAEEVFRRARQEIQ